MPMKKINWPLVLAILACVLFWLTFAVTFARAASQDPRLDAVATAVAGHPVTVSCASSEHEWITFEDTAFPGQSFNADGFTFVGRGAVIWLAPRICDTLEADLHVGPSTVGTYWNALAIKVLLHEASHQAGIVDEGAADCNALALVKQYAVSSFGYPATVTKVTYRRATKTTYRRVVRRVPNPALAQLYASALMWHRALPPSYQGGC